MEPQNIEKNKSFLQSPEWENFQRSLGRKTRRIRGVLLVEHDLPLGFSYLYTGHPDTGGDISELVREVKKTGQGNVFLKVDPVREIKCASGWTKAETLQPKQSVVIGLMSSEDEILRDMHEKTRYNIRLAERKGVRVVGETFETFWRLLSETTARDEFHAHPEEHYKKLLQVRSNEFSNELFFAEYGGRPVAAAIVNFYRPANTAVYLHGASSNESREVMAPHLLHWEIIKEAKRRGFGHYDLWGIDEVRWPGLTRFKKGFGGAVVSYPGAVDVPLRPFWYRAYRVAKKFR